MSNISLPFISINAENAILTCCDRLKEMENAIGTCYLHAKRSMDRDLHARLTVDIISMEAYVKHIQTHLKTIQDQLNLLARITALKKTNDTDFE